MRNRYARLATLVLASAASFACAALAWGGHKSPDVPAPATEDVASKRAELSADERATNARLLKLPLGEPKIVVTKAERRLRLFDGAEVLRVFPVALGFGPEGDKVRARDGRTPEGEFHVCMKNARSQFYLSLGLTYPAEEDAERGLRDRLITRAQRDRIVSAVREGQCPPWDTPLGGEIFIHGGGVASDWTWGCVALENTAVKELFDAVPPGTPVVIKP